MGDLQALIKERILLVDGAMGTMIQGGNLSASDFGGPQYEGCNEHLVLSKPKVIEEIHEAYLEAGADIQETDTFGATRIVLAEYGLQDKTLDINREAARLAKRLAEKYSTPSKPRFVAGSMGPTTKSLSVTGGATFDELLEAYAEQARGLLEGGADVLLLETAQDTLNLKAGLFGIERTFEEMGRRIPVLVSATIEVMGTTLAGQGIEALYISLKHRGLLSLGLNCATGPDFMTDHIRTLASISHWPVSCIPNAGLPDENGRYNETPEMFAAKLERFMQEGWINLVGGCCGTTPEHIRRLARLAETYRPRVPQKHRRCLLSGLEPLEVTEDRRPILVGERTNVIGSRKFKELIGREAYEEASEVGRRQVRSMAHILDVCLANPDRDEKADMERFLDILVKKVKVPLSIDSTDPAVIETALKRCPGRALVNSINLEDGEERFQAVVPFLKRYGAAVVVGTIDEDKAQGMAVTRQRKLAIAERSHALLTQKYGLRSEDLVFDPLVFPVGTGDANYFGSAVETLEGLKLIKERLPHCKTILGISNVSFGLPPAGREVLNSVFLHHCIQAGLDLAIVNTERLARYPSIPEEERRLCEDLLFWKGPSDPDRLKGFDPIAAFAAHFREAAGKGDSPHPGTVPAPAAREALPVEERLARSVVEGSKEGLLQDLDEILKRLGPLEIINGPLMKGMDEVGRLFAANELIVAEVLQSAEVMKAAVVHLEPRMDRTQASSRGKVVLATVKGDVHDIGKNLVHIILKNNGYEITDLGIKVAPETLIEAVKKISPHVLGLSGLLVKSAQQMVVTVDDLLAAGIGIPILVGGAALTPKFTASRIAPRYEGPVIYSKDAMQGLEFANQLQDPRRRDILLARNKEIQEYLSCTTAPSTPSSIALRDAKPALFTPGLPSPSGRGAVLHDHSIPTPPDLKLHVIEDFRLEEVFAYVNPIMLYGKHLGLRGSPERLFKEEDPKALALKKQVEELEAEILARKLIRARAVYRFYACSAEAESLRLFETPAGLTNGRPAETFLFPRQPSGERLCLSDFSLPSKEGRPDYAALFVVTCGEGIRELSTELREKGAYFKSHALQALAIECAEALAELLHEKLRKMWGIADPPGMTLREKFQAKYRGLRVSFGYPACPNLEDQAKLFKLLKPEDSIGVRLTEGFMMDPEASVSALVFHHPQARYFTVAPAS